MAHHSHWYRTATVWLKPFTHTLCIITRTIYYFFTANITFVRVNNPLITDLGHTCCRTKSLDSCAHVTSSLSQRLCKLGRINISVIRIPKATRQIMRFKEWVGVLHIGYRHHLYGQALIPTHRASTLKFLHSLFIVC